MIKKKAKGKATKKKTAKKKSVGEEQERAESRRSAKDIARLVESEAEEMAEGGDWRGEEGTTGSSEVFVGDGEDLSEGDGRESGERGGRVPGGDFAAQAGPSGWNRL